MHEQRTLMGIAGQGLIDPTRCVEVHGEATGVPGSLSSLPAGLVNGKRKAEFCGTVFQLVVIRGYTNNKLDPNLYYK